MRKLWKCRKALSPVVAAIILIAVTVAVSIAVAAWMGALTFTFMKTEELKVTNVVWATGNTKAVLTVKNTGTGGLTLSAIRVNANLNTTSPGWDSVGAKYTMNPGDTATVNVYAAGWGLTGFTSGTKYEFALYTATGNRYPYTDTAP